MKITAIAEEDYPFIGAEVFNKSLPETPWPGHDFEVFRTFCQLIGVDYDVIQAYDHEYGALINGSWNGIVGMLSRHQANMSACTLTYNAERAKVVDYGPPIYYYGYAAAIRNPGAEPMKFVLFKPLSVPVWACFLSAFLVVTVAFALLSFATDRINGKLRAKNRLWQKNRHTVSYNIWVSICCLLQQGVTVKLNSSSFYLLFIAWNLVLLVMVQSYTGILISFLTATPNLNIPFSNFETFADVLLTGQYRLIDETEEAVSEKLLSPNISYARKVLQAIKTYPVRVLPPKDPEHRISEDEHFRKIFGIIEKDPMLAYFGQDFYIRRAIAQENLCGLEVVEFHEDRRWMSFIFPKNSSLHKLAQEKLAGATSFMYALQHKYVHKHRCKPSPTASSLRFDQMHDSVLLLTVGIVTSVLLFAAERLLYKKVLHFLETLWQRLLAHAMRWRQEFSQKVTVLAPVESAGVAGTSGWPTEFEFDVGSGISAETQSNTVLITKL